jgi:hypothetical protein
MNAPADAVGARADTLKVAVLAIGLAAVGVEAVVLLSSLRHDSTDPRAGATAASALVAPPPALPSRGSFVASNVQGDGTIQVTQWIRSPTAVSRLGLAAYDTPLPTARPRATDLEVTTGDGTVLVSGLVVTTRRQVVDLEKPARVLRMTYSLEGVVDRSGSVTGRALAGVTFLDVDYPSAGGPTTVEVTGGQVLNLACAAAEVETTPRRPCGAPDAVGWSVTLSEKDRDDRVTAQLDLGRATATAAAETAPSP